MATQAFKSVYFPEAPENNRNNHNGVLTLAFGEKDKTIFKKVYPLSSQEIRELLGFTTYSALEENAQQEGLPLNTYCLWLLRKRLSDGGKQEKSQDSLFSIFNPIHATFKGGEKDPLHKWYPYLEGYSPSFVRRVLEEFAPDAKVVYDPFSGVGTTPLVAADSNLGALYSEINPLLQFITAAKINARNLSSKDRVKVLKNLENLAENFRELLKENPPDRLLGVSYQRIFGKSIFFDTRTYIQVLKTRTLIDSLAGLSPIGAQLLTVAVLSSLIPSSLLQRAGDLRFKTKKELENKKVDFVSEVQKYLKLIIGDLQDIFPLSTKPLLITEDARNIASISNLQIDTVITSPPYLNGTNYFRNTKVELWFLRSLTSQQDLSSFRRKSVTAGINDVSLRTPKLEIPKSVQKVVAVLEDNAYDRRIPKMVHDYFQDMSIIFGALTKHLQKDSLIAIDIGDSLYSNIHVPTDKLLIDTLVEKGYKHERSILLRKRASRNGFVLKQVLLTFRFQQPRKRARTLTGKRLQLRDWEEFKVNLSHKQHPFSKRNWGHPLHSLCSYQGKMKPSLAYHLIKSFTKPGDTILDPFAGVGTIPFEGALNGVESYGFEISPAAIAIAQAKLGLPSIDRCLETIERLDKYIKKKKPTKRELEGVKSFGFNKKLIDYYEAKTLSEILLARRYFSKYPPKDSSEALVLASLLHILHGNRPYALSRRSHGITPFSPTGEFVYKPLIPHLRKKVNKSLSVNLPLNFVEGKMFFQDATLWWPQEVDNLDAVITSPPFFDSTRFHLANWIRLWFCGWNNKEFKEKPLYFVDERQKQTFEVYEPILRQSRERLKPGGVVVFHLGHSKKCNMAEEIAKIAKKWFKIKDIFSENVQDTESHGIRDKGTVVEHQYLVLS